MAKIKRKGVRAQVKAYLREHPDAEWAELSKRFKCSGSVISVARKELGITVSPTGKVQGNGYRAGGPKQKGSNASARDGMSGVRLTLEVMRLAEKAGGLEAIGRVLEILRAAEALNVES